MTSPERAAATSDGGVMYLDLMTMTGLATLSVSLWTVRVAVTAKGLRLAAAVVAAVEAIVFVAAFSRVTSRLDSAGALAAYAAGVGVGTLLGLVGHARLSRGHSQVDVVAPAGSATRLTAGLQRRGWPTTAAAGEGLSGPVVLASITVDDDRVDALLCDIDRLAPDAFWTVRAIRAASPVPLPPGLTQIRGRHRWSHHRS